MAEKRDRHSHSVPHEFVDFCPLVEVFIALSRDTVVVSLQPCQSTSSVDASVLVCLAASEVDIMADKMDQSSDASGQLAKMDHSEVHYFNR